MELPHQMTTLTRVLERLKERNMDLEFRWSPEGFSTGDQNFYQPGELEIIRVFRFEGITDPADMCIVYLLLACDGRIGYSLNAYGAYSDHDDEEGYDNFIRLVPVRGHEDQMLFAI
ncbi:hypothetical protein [Sediminibacterium ginsengisoli]|uniref:Uncharacterized protein n=1 Tax=Sediminibacterium ginsengisoli TaxID=413434 RepID=A0A1T4RRC9_9BACT|nr:hypothetical protein [Sediminibacterium ginsengisoli]SKA18492.1 hypothetical protein SAMN04488132_11423 [Sediminibacterium ginsengisoli]